MKSRPEPSTLDEISNDCACFNLRRAARAITQLYDHALAPSGLRATQFTLLVALAKAGAVPFTRLADALGMDRTTLTRNLAPLERAEFLSMRPGPDRRVKLITISDQGRKALAAATPFWERVQRRITGDVGPARWDTIRRDINRITALAGDAGAAARAPRPQARRGARP